MPITLKHITLTDSDQIKLDKVNYNFDQLVANEGGPEGPQGAIGQQGPQGVTGQRGTQGVTGTEGFQGPEGKLNPNYWHKIAPGAIDAVTLVPIHTSPDAFAPVINIGFVDSDPEFGTKAPLVDGKTPYQWVINRKIFSESNLRLTTNAASGKYVDFDLRKGTSSVNLNVNFSDYTNSVSVLQGAGFLFRKNKLATNILTLSSASTFFRRETIFNTPVHIKQSLSILGAGAALNKIVTSEDVTGLVKFKTIYELSGTLPYGTIVSILPSIFTNSSNFINSEVIDTSSNPNSTIRLTIGRGVGLYSGWYLCHGKTWYKPGLTDTHIVPMLGKFNYQIDDNASLSPTSQGLANNTDQPGHDKIHITSGSEINMTAQFAGPTQSYTITGTVDTSPILNQKPGGGPTFVIKQLPQIIYLDETDLYWEDPGTGQSPNIPVTFLLDDANTSASKLSPDPYPLGVAGGYNEQPGQTHTFDVYSPLGYHWSSTPSNGSITGLPTGITIQGITRESGAFPQKITITLLIDVHPSTSQQHTLGINTSSFISSSTASITLVRQTVMRTTVTPADTTIIQYNFATGFDFQLIYTAIPGYQFLDPQTGVVSYISGSTTSSTPPTGGGTITILNRVVSTNKTTLTINCRLDGIPNVGYLTTLNYAIGVNIRATAPTMTPFSPAVAYPGIQTPPDTPTPAKTRQVTVTNNTGSTVYFWVGIEQTSNGSSVAGQVNASFEISNGGIISSIATPSATQTILSITGSSMSLHNGQNLSGTLKRNGTTDALHNVGLYWAFLSNATNQTKRRINFEQ